MEMTYVYAKAPGEGLDRLTQLIKEEERVQHFERTEHNGAQVLYFEVLNHRKEPQDLFERLLEEVPSAKLYWQCMDWEHWHFRSNDTGHEFFNERYAVRGDQADIDQESFSDRFEVLAYVEANYEKNVGTMKNAEAVLNREGVDLVKIRYRKEFND